MEKELYKYEIENNLKKELVLLTSFLERIRNSKEKIINLKTNTDIRYISSFLYKLNNLEFLYSEKLKKTKNCFSCFTETAFLTKNYKNILRNSINIFDEAIKKGIFDEKKYIKDIFLEKTFFYFRHCDLFESKDNKSKKIEFGKRKSTKCKNCNSENYEYLKEDLYVCSNCYCILDYIDNSGLEINLKQPQHNKYNYNKKMHFIECINQFQCKQKKTIPLELLEKIKKCLKFDGYYTNDEDLKNIKKHQIMAIINNLKETKFYSDVALIHHKITGVEPFNIEFLKNKLLEDFDIILQKYKIFSEKNNMKNFINIQFILYQLLNKNGFDVSVEHFNLLKTKEKKEKHEYICKQLFSDLGWKYTPIS